MLSPVFTVASLVNWKRRQGQYRMSILGAGSYAAVCHLVTDVEALSTEERSHVLWYACDGGDLSMVNHRLRPKAGI